jgi:MoaA/NifB/PqqE/SkfB family radical SAM enzyme
MRNYRGLDYNSGYPLCELSVVDFKHILPPSVLPQLTQGVSFNGNLGDFASAKNALEIVEYLVEHQVKVKINTNGGLRNSSWWRRLALPGVEIGFALDGLADTHELYRLDTVWQRVIDHAQAFIDAGGQAVWRFIPFEHNQHQEQQCRDLAKSMGFVKFENIYDGRDTGPVFTRTGKFSHHIGQPYSDQVPDIKPLLESHVTWYDAKTYRSPKDTPELTINCFHKRNREIYIAADGSVYPCCYLGFYPHTMKHPGNRELAPMVQENNALQYPLEHCLEWFESVEQAWHKSSIAEGRPYQCVNTCGQNKI